jgi:PAS domain S-box-containing protein
MARYQGLRAQGTDHLEHLARMAAHVVRCDVALVARVDRAGRSFDHVAGVEAALARALRPLCQCVWREGLEVALADARSLPAFAVLPVVAAPEGPRRIATRLLRGADASVLGVLVACSPSPEPFETREFSGLVLAAQAIARHLAATRELDTLRDRHAEQLHELDRLRGILRGARRFAVVSADAAGYIETLNEGARAMLGYAPDEPIVGGIDQLFDPDTLRTVAATLGLDLRASDAWLTALRKLGARPEGDTRDWRWRRKDGSMVPVHVSLHAVRDEDRRLTGYVLLAQDISERVAAERMKDEFIATVSHELRTPITAIRGALGLLRGGVLGALPDEAHELLALADDQSLRLGRLVDDLLDLRRIEAGRVELQRAPCLLHALAHNAVTAHVPLAASRDLRFELLDDPTSPLPPRDVVVTVDPDRMMQVFANLLSNAVKFSPRGATVRVLLRADATAARVTVEDHGPGVAPEFRAQLFQKFARFQRCDGDGVQVPGTGLGLSVVRALVQCHGGTVGFEPLPWGGSAFWFELPREHEPRKEKAP